ncbi:MAG: MarR family transcriptional regulator [Clostridia bacterium]|nr:MarR family transcriptional regulator [Clostridia bacterium]
MTEKCDRAEGEFRLIRRFRDVGHKLKRLGDVNLETKGITFSQLRVLVFLMRRPPEEGVLQRDLEEAFGIRRSSVTSILQNMEKADLIRRDAVDGDGRKKRIRVTEKGRKLDGELRAYMDELEDELAGIYTPQEMELLSTLTEKMLAKLKQMEGERL